MTSPYESAARFFIPTHSTESSQLRADFGHLPRNVTAGVLGDAPHFHTGMFFLFPFSISLEGPSLAWHWQWLVLVLGGPLPESSLGPWHDVTGKHGPFGDNAPCPCNLAPKPGMFFFFPFLPPLFVIYSRLQWLLGGALCPGASSAQDYRFL